MKIEPFRERKSKARLGFCKFINGNQFEIERIKGIERKNDQMRTMKFRELRKAR